MTIAHIRSNPFAHTLLDKARVQFEYATGEVHIDYGTRITTLSVFDALEEALSKIGETGPVSRLKIRYKLIDRNSCIIECTNGYKQALFYIDNNNNFLQVSNRPKAEILATTPHIDFVDADLKELAKDVVNSLAI